MHKALKTGRNVGYTHISCVTLTRRDGSHIMVLVASIKVGASPMADIHPLYAALGKRIRALRRQANLSQEDVAERVGLTRTSITNIERGRQQLQIHTLVAIAHTLGVRLDELLLYEEEPAHGNNEAGPRPGATKRRKQKGATATQSPQDYG